MNKYRLLFNAYSPFKTNKTLVKSYIDITYDGLDDNTKVRELYNNLIKANYPNEAVIKASFLEFKAFKLSPFNTVTIFELNSNNSRVDLCMINGKSEVFEIKTEFDTFNRLDDQLSDYLKLYDFINIIIPEDSFTNQINSIPLDVGIITYYKNRLGNYSFKYLRNPTLNNQIDPLVQLNQLTKQTLYKESKLSNRSLSKDKLIKHLHTNLSKDEINSLFKRETKLKYASNWQFLHQNQKNIYPLDYQWFFKNNINYEIIYR